MLQIIYSFDLAAFSYIGFWYCAVPRLRIRRDEWNRTWDLQKKLTIVLMSIQNSRFELLDVHMNLHVYVENFNYFTDYGYGFGTYKKMMQRKLWRCMKG
jgi:hypothetical protein